VFRYLPLLLLACALAFLSLRGPAPAHALAVPDYVTTGGWFNQPPTMISDPNQKVTFGGVLQCDAPFDQPNQLIVHYTGTIVNVDAEFKLETVTSATCTLNNPNDPNSGGRWQGSGSGSCNGGPATAFLIEFNDTGQGNPGDNARFSINGSMPGCAFAVFATALDGGQITLHAQ
jgi:hypothetical protein